MANEEIVDQTQFQEESPLLELRSAHKKVSPEEPSQPPRWKTLLRKYWWAAALAGFFIVMLLVVLMASMSRGPAVPTVKPSPSPKSQPPKSTGIEAKLDEIDAQLQAADPARPSLPFPEIDDSLSLENRSR